MENDLTFPQIIDGLSAPLATTTADGRVEFANRQFLDYLGVSLEELESWETTGVVHPDDLARVVTTWSQSLERGEPFEIELRVRRAGGVYQWGQVRGLPLRDGQGHIVHWCVLLSDIAERKRTQALLDGETRLLEMVASGRRLDEILDTMCAIVDSIVGNSVCSILLIGPNGTFRHGAGPTLPSGYDAMVDGAPVVCEAGPCGTAASTKQQVIVPDLGSDPRWVGLGWRTLVLEHGLRSVCSTPILSLTGQALGTFAIYQRDPGPPGAPPLGELVTRFTHIASIAIERAISERKLQESESNLKLTIDTIPALAWSARPDGSAEFFNRHYLDYVGLSADEACGWGWTIAVHPDDLSHLAAAWQRITASDAAGETEARLRRHDGEYRWFLIRSNPLRDETGAIVRWYGVNTDIDDRKKVEQALQSSERNLSLMINAIPTFIQMSRPDGTVLSVNQTVLDYHGVSLQDVQKEDFRARFYHPDDAERLRDVRKEGLKRPLPFEYEQRARGKDGKYRWFMVRYSPLLDEQGRIDRWYAAAFDVEDRKQAEAELRRAYDSFAEAQGLSHTGSFITDLVGDDHNWSDEAFRIFEFEPGSKVSVQRIRDMIHSDDLPSFESMIARGMTGENVTFAFRIVTGAGAVKHVRGVAHVVEHVAGRPLFVGALQDVTESKVAEEALDRARSELARVARVTAVSAFTASIAHEVNQPLSGIITNAGTCLRMLAADPPDVDGARETAKRTLRDGNRASDVITRLRALFSKREFTLEPLDINEIAQEVVALSLSELQRNRMVLRAEFGADLPPITGDRIQLQQVILNLLRNASDAMLSVEDQPRHLLMATGREADNRVRLSVRDVGVGLDAQSMDKLFDAFFTTKTDGMGIGLSVSRSIIERHHGRLWAEPNDGPGTTFAFALPAAPETVVRATDTKV